MSPEQVSHPFLGLFGCVEVDVGPRGVGVGVKVIPLLLLDKHLVMASRARACTTLVDLQPHIVPETTSVEFQMLPLRSVFGVSGVRSGIIRGACNVVRQLPLPSKAPREL
jgi:hypothetical protein